jgi:hypothetical protein
MFRDVVGLRRPGLALVALSVVEQRLDAVRAVLAGASVTELRLRLGFRDSRCIRGWGGI